MKEKYTPSYGEQEIINLVLQEKSNWEDGHVFITDKVQYVMRNVIKKARKNYFGVFNEERDPVTGREKIFIPMTEWTVETMLKNIDVDTKDINIKARNESGYRSAPIFKKILQKTFDDIRFGRTLNKLLRRTAIDGTGILKAVKDEKGGLAGVYVVDRMNIIFDPTCEDIAESPSIIERHLMTLPEFQEMGLDNSDKVEGVTAIDRTGFDIVNADVQSTEVPFVELYERYGWVCKEYITGKESDSNTYVYTRALLSGLNGQPIVHSVEEMEESEHPYGFFKMKEAPNRADGRGLAEMLFNIQAYVNEVVNTRLNASRMAHQKLWKLRGSITPQQLRRLFATSAIKLGANDDIEPIDTGSIDPSSYKDEEMANMWATRVTGTSNSDEVADNRPATNALIQQQSTSKEYNLRMEDLFMELAHFLEKKVVPLIKAGLKEGDIVRITGDPKDLEKMEEPLIRQAIYKKINEADPVDKMAMTDAGMESLIEMAKQDMKEFGNMRFAEISKEAFDFDFDLDIIIGDEQINRAIMAQTLQATLGIMAQAGLPMRDTLRELFDTLGLDADRLVETQPEQAPVQEGEVPTQEELTPAGMSEVPTPGAMV